MAEKICRVCKNPFEPYDPRFGVCPLCCKRYMNGERHLTEKCKVEREQKTLF